MELYIHHGVAVSDKVNPERLLSESGIAEV